MKPSKLSLPAGAMRDRREAIAAGWFQLIADTGGATREPADLRTRLDAPRVDLPRPGEGEEQAGILGNRPSPTLETLAEMVPETPATLLLESLLDLAHAELPASEKDQYSQPGLIGERLENSYLLPHGAPLL